MLARLQALAQARADFAFETTLAGRNFAPWLRELGASGYRVHLAFVSLPSPELALERVAERVRRGGHDIPEDIVHRRFRAGLRNFFGLYQQIADSWRMFDNSDVADLRLIASGGAEQPTEIQDAAVWSDLVERSQ